MHTGQHYDRELSEVFIEELGLPRPSYRLELKTADPERWSRRSRASSVARAARPRARLRRHELDPRRRARVRRGVRSARARGGRPAQRRPGDAGGAHASRSTACPGSSSAPTTARARRSPTKASSAGPRGRRRDDGGVPPFAPIARGRVPDSVRARELRRGDGAPGGERLPAAPRHIIEGEPASGAGRLPGPSAHARPASRRRARARRSHPSHRSAGYLELASLASQARVIATDSGGLQKEAYWYEVPCVTLVPPRNGPTRSSRPNVLVDDDPDAIEERWPPRDARRHAPCCTETATPPPDRDAGRYDAGR